MYKNVFVAFISEKIYSKFRPFLAHFELTATSFSLNPSID